MRYITGIERRAIKKGYFQGLMNSMPFCLEIKFGESGLELMSEISQIEDLETLRAVVEGLRHHDTLDKIRAIYRDQNKKLSRRVSKQGPQNLERLQHQNP